MFSSKSLFLDKKNDVTNNIKSDKNDDFLDEII